LRPLNINSFKKIGNYPIVKEETITRMVSQRFVARF